MRYTRRTLRDRREHHAVRTAYRYFGPADASLELRDTPTSSACGTADKTFTIGIAFGANVVVCDNMSFMGEHRIHRKHTAGARRALPGLLADIVQPLQQARAEQHDRLTVYQRTPIADEMADHAVVEMLRRGIIGVKAIPRVLRQWTAPTHDWGGKTAWRLFNCATIVLGAKVMDCPRLTTDLHEVLDRICERTNPAVDAVIAAVSANVNAHATTNPKASRRAETRWRRGPALEPGGSRCRTLRAYAEAEARAKSKP
jgi:hypothetical protein